MIGRRAASVTPARISWIGCQCQRHCSGIWRNVAVHRQYLDRQQSMQVWASTSALESINRCCLKMGSRSYRYGRSRAGQAQKASASRHVDASTRTPGRELAIAAFSPNLNRKPAASFRAATLACVACKRHYRVQPPMDLRHPYAASGQRCQAQWSSDHYHRSFAFQR
jgi:hypothetical protein